jgi:predicted transcriptional regulator
MRKAFLQPYSIVYAIVGLCFLLGGLMSGHTFLFPFAAGFFGAFISTPCFTGLRSLKERRATCKLALKRSELSELSLAVLEAIGSLSQPNSSMLGTAFACDLSAQLREEKTVIEQELQALERCGLVSHLEGHVGAKSGKFYFQAQPDIDQWLEGERARRDFLLEQAGPAPGPRSRRSELAG